MSKCILLLSALLGSQIAFAGERKAAVLDQAAEERGPIFSYAIKCTLDAKYEPIASSMGKGRGPAVYSEARDCLESKLPAALEQAKGLPELTAAIKDWHVKALLWLQSPRNRSIEDREREAGGRLELEAKLAKAWD